MNHPEKVAIVGRTMHKALKNSIATPGVIRFKKSASELLDFVMKEGVEHH